jgi:2-methylcitrate dehydratase PrpD
VAARTTDYVAATLNSVDRGGPCTAIAHEGSFDAFDAALVNGTAAHGEDFDDTFEGGPVHAGAVVVPAVLAACEREGLAGERLLVGIAAGAELMCRPEPRRAKGDTQGRISPDGCFRGAGGSRCCQRRA